MSLFRRISFMAALLVALLSFPAEGKDESARSLYVRRYKALAINEMKRSNIPASIILAQGMLESDCGRSTLAVEGKNHFGIKCHGWSGDTIEADDDSAGECFRKYKSASASYRDHTDFLLGRTRYGKLFALASDDYKGWARGLQECGYATDPYYAERLISLIESEKLYRFDASAESETVKDVEAAALFEADGPGLEKFSIDRPVFHKDGAPYIIASEFDTYRSLAKEYHLFRRELLRYNGLKKSPDSINRGTAVFIGRKIK